MKTMATNHISESELALSLASILDRVRSGEEIVIERNAHAIAILKAIAPRPRKLSEIMAALPENSSATLDEDFSADLQAVIDSHREPLNPPQWD